MKDWTPTFKSQGGFKMNLTFLQRNLLLDVFSNLESIIREAQLIQELKNTKLNDFCTF